MDWKTRGEDLLAEYAACCRARPYNNAVEVELAKESCARFVSHLNTQLNWGTDNDVAEACYQLEPRLEKFKKTVILDILSNGTI